MRIMHLVLKPRYSGAEILARDLCLLQNNDHTVSFASLDPAQSDFSKVITLLKLHNVLVYCPVNENGRVRRVIHLIMAFIRFKPDVVFAHSQIPTYYAKIIAIFLRIKVVKVMHNASGEEFGFIDKLIMRRNSHVIGVNKSHLDVYCNGSAGKVIPHYIPNGVFLDNIRKAHKLNRTDSRGVIILQVGRICDMKGQINSINAVSLLKDVDLEFWIAGIVENSEYAVALNSISDKLGVVVRNLGGRSDIPELLATADIILMPSNHEAHPIGYLEALASGKFVVVNDIAVFREQGEFDGVVFVNRDDSQMFHDAIKMGMNCGQIFCRDLDRFDIQKTSRRYLDVALIVMGASRE